MRDLILAASVAFFATTTSAAQAGWDMVTITRNEASICVAKESIRLDDRVTSPEIIALAGMRSCQPKIREFDEAMTEIFLATVPMAPRGRDDPNLRNVIEEHHADLKSFAIQAVLEGRAYAPKR